MHEALVNRLGGLSLPRKSVVRLTDRPDMTLDVYRGRKTTIQQQQPTIAMKFSLTSPMIALKMAKTDSKPGGKHQNMESSSQNGYRFIRGWNMTL